MSAKRLGASRLVEQCPVHSFRLAFGCETLNLGPRDERFPINDSRRFNGKALFTAKQHPDNVQNQDSGEYTCGPSSQDGKGTEAKYPNAGGSHRQQRQQPKSSGNRPVLKPTCIQDARIRRPLSDEGVHSHAIEL